MDFVGGQKTDLHKRTLTYAHFCGIPLGLTSNTEPVRNDLSS